MSTTQPLSEFLEALRLLTEATDVLLGELRAKGADETPSSGATPDTSRERLHWTDEEDDLVLEHYASSAPVIENLAAKLRRTPGAVSNRAHVLGCTTIERARWNEGEKGALSFMWGQGVELAVLAQTFDRTEQAIHHQVRRLGLPDRQ